MKIHLLLAVIITVLLIVIESSALPEYYRTLGIKKNANKKEIQKAYHKLARKYHPDKNKARYAVDAFRKIVEAYQVLSNRDERQRYDDQIERHPYFTHNPTTEEYHSHIKPPRGQGNIFSDIFECIKTWLKWVDTLYYNTFSKGNIYDSNFKHPKQRCKVIRTQRGNTIIEVITGCFN